MNKKKKKEIIVLHFRQSASIKGIRDFWKTFIQKKKNTNKNDEIKDTTLRFIHKKGRRVFALSEKEHFSLDLLFYE